jgi:hypothetical protein
MISLEMVIQRILASEKNPNNPAYRAHATRALRTYSVNRAIAIGSTPKSVIAGVRAAVTKRKLKSKQNKKLLLEIAKNGKDKPKSGII